MNELINITTATINHETVNAVNARDLWENLGSKRQFGNWIKDRLDGFIEGQDFAVNKNVKGEDGRFQPTEYIISLDVAKHIAMLERNEQGRKVRQYFIEIEKNARKFSEAVSAQVSAMIPVIRENERLRFQLDFARHFLPVGQPGEPGKDGKPKNFYRRGFYTSRNGKPVTALVERYDQPGLFDEIELKKLN